MTPPPWEPGTYWRLSLPEGGYGYARLAQEPYAAFLDLRSDAPITDVGGLQGVARAFVVSIETRALARWEPLGPDPAGTPLDDPPRQYHRIRGNPSRYSIFEPDGTQRPITAEEAAELEPMAVWNGPSVARRLDDHLLGRPHEALERLRRPD